MFTCDGVGGMLLHHRHVLVGRRVEDHARGLFGDQPIHRRRGWPRSRGARAARRSPARGRAADSSSRWTRYSGLSARSTRISRRGPRAHTWRASSDPIDPPAPVMTTVRSRMISSTPPHARSRSGAEAGPRPGPGGRGRHRRSRRAGRSSTGRFGRRGSMASAASTTRRTALPGAPGIVIAASAPRSRPRRAAATRVRRRPRRPATIPPVRLGSSSRKPTGRTPAPGSRTAERASMTPARPAPYRSVARRSGASPGPAAGARSDAALTPNRTPPMMAVTSRASISQNERGNPSAHAAFAKTVAP